MAKLNFKLEDIIKLYNSGYTIQALKKVENIILSNKESLELLNIYVQLLIKTNKKESGIVFLEKIFSEDPRNINILNSLATLHIAQNNNLKAIKYIDDILVIDKSNVKANRDKAYLLYKDKDYSKSRKFIDLALKKSSNDFFAFNISGLIYMQENNFRKAIKCFRNAVDINVNYVDSYNNLGTCYYRLEDLKRAFYYFKKSYKKNKENIVSISNIANILSLSGKNDIAKNLYEKALKINPENKEIFSNYILNFFRKKDKLNSEKYFKKFIKISPHDNELMYSYSTFQLSINNFEEGWKYFDNRLMIKKNTQNLKNFSFTKEKALNVNNLKKDDNIYILREQGIGEEILFSSVYWDLIKNYKNIQIESDKRLISIFKRSFGKNIFYEDGNNLNHNNKYIYAGSLLKFFRKNEEDFPKMPYLIADDERIKIIKNKIYKNKEKLIVGISWKSVINIFGKLKSLDIKDFESLFNDDRLIVNLQYGNIIDDLKYINSRNKNLCVLNDIDLFNDIESCIALLKNLDYFVTVSNSTAHLAGALGVPTILIVPNKSSSYFYWNTSNRSSIWYNSIKIITIDDSIKKTMRHVNEIII